MQLKQMNTYLFFNGQCEAAFKFYEKVLGGKILAMMTAEGSPAENQVSPEMRKKIMHARMSIGDKVLMASDAPPDRYNAPKGFFINLGFEKPAEVEGIFKTLAEGGTVQMQMQMQMPMAETFWAHRFGMVVDRFGTPWMVNCEKVAA